MSARRFLYVHLSCPRHTLSVPRVLPRGKALLSPAAISEGSEGCISCGSSCCKPNKQILSASHKSAASHNLCGINILSSLQLRMEHFGLFPCSSADSQKKKKVSSCHCLKRVYLVSPSIPAYLKGPRTNIPYSIFFHFTRNLFYI